MQTIDMDELADKITALGLDTYVTHSGGGCATLMVMGDEPNREYPLALAGPGWFDGPGWTNARGSWDEFCWGIDDDGGDFVTYEQQPRSLDAVAQDIYETAQACLRNIQTNWSDVAPEDRPHWAATNA